MGGGDPAKEDDDKDGKEGEGGPDGPLRSENNGIRTLETGIKKGRQVEPNIEYREEQDRGQENMAQVRQALNIPLATNMCTTSFGDIPNSIRLGAEDIILSAHHFWGGLRASMTLAGICETFGR